MGKSRFDIGMTRWSCGEQIYRNHGESGDDGSSLVRGELMVICKFDYCLIIDYTVMFGYV